jgi:hypothetical protein
MPEQPTAEVAAYQRLAAALHETADRIMTAFDQSRALAHAPAPYAKLQIVPGHPGTDIRNRELVDTVALAIFGEVGHNLGPSSTIGGRHWGVERLIGHVLRVGVHGVVPDPAHEELLNQLAARDTEISQLRTQLAAAETTTKPNAIMTVAGAGDQVHGVDIGHIDHPLSSLTGPETAAWIELHHDPDRGDWLAVDPDPDPDELASYDASGRPYRRVRLTEEELDAVRTAAVTTIQDETYPDDRPPTEE